MTDFDLDSDAVLTWSVIALGLIAGGGLLLIFG